MKTTHILIVLLTALGAAVEVAAAEPRVATDAAPYQWSRAYEYDGAGNVVKIGTDVFVYDKSGRLVEAHAGTAVSPVNRQTFGYDRYGNLLNVVTETGTVVSADSTTKLLFGVEGETNRLTNDVPCAADLSALCMKVLEYDSAGNVKAMPAATLSWDALGALAELNVQNRQERYLYDADGERVATVAMSLEPGAPETHRYTLRGLDGKVVREVQDDVTGTTHEWSWTKDYVYRSGSLLAAVQNDGGNEVRRHFHLDHLGSPRVITDDTGFLVAEHTYWPFGEDAPGSTTDTERMRFTGHERDFNGGIGPTLDYMHARYYGAKWGRFLSVDPTLESADLGRPQSWNRYAYVENNPINKIDPDGRCPGCSLLGFQPPQEWVKPSWGIAFLVVGTILTKGDLLFGAESTSLTADRPPVDLAQRAKDIHSALPEATQRRTTTAVATVANPDGTSQIVVASSEKNLRPSQRAALKTGEKAVSGVGHAEQTIVNAAAANGQKVKAVAASRPICPSCAAAIKKAGAEAAGVLKRIATLVF